MTGSLTYAATSEHIDELRAAAGNSRRRKPRKPRRERRLPGFPGVRRPRLAA